MIQRNMNSAITINYQQVPFHSYILEVPVVYMHLHCTSPCLIDCSHPHYRTDSYIASVNLPCQRLVIIDYSCCKRISAVIYTAEKLSELPRLLCLRGQRCH